ncbi:MAG: GerAB/ArcD/ProY family transporter [Clostridia bacterium]|nr:GerAB/ArcD/ProY family transporter [Clostridia bacterium]
METHSLSTRQYGALLTASAFGAGILTLPRYLCAAAGQDGWVIVLLSGAVMCASGLLYLRLCRRYPGLSLPAIVHRALPVPAAFLSCLLLLCFFLITAASSIRVVTEVTLLYLLPNTPLWAVALVYVLFILYALQGGGRGVGRFCEMTGFLLPLSFLLLLPSLQGAQATNLAPALTCDPSALFSALPMASYSFGISLLVPVFLPLTEDPRAAGRATLPRLLFVAAAFVLICLLAVAVLGADTVSHMLFPVITLYKSVTVPVIERLDLFFLTLWTVLAVRPCLNFACAAVQLTDGALQKRVPHRGLTFAVGGLLFLLMLAQSDIILTIRIIHYLGYGYFLLGILLPILCLLSPRGRKEPSCD